MCLSDSEPEMNDGGAVQTDLVPDGQTSYYEPPPMRYALGVVCVCVRGCVMCPYESIGAYCFTGDK